MEKKYRVAPPTMPNFYHLEGNLNEVKPITEFTREEAELFAEFMKDTFMNHWEQKAQIKEEEYNKMAKAMYDATRQF